MAKSTILILLVSFSFACRHQDKSVSSPYDQTCKSFLDALFKKNTQVAIAQMDDVFRQVAGNMNLDSTFNLVSEKIINEFGATSDYTLTTSERTIHADLPSTFLVYKIETSSKFGYYFFYINEKTKKILLFAEFSRIKPKR